MRAGGERAVVLSVALLALSLGACRRPTPTPRVPVLPRYSFAGSGWNDYLLNDGLTRLTATDLPCAATEPGAYDACIHGGEIREVDARSLPSCLGATAQDDLGAFDWVCLEEADGPVIVSTGLRDEVRLVELIDWGRRQWRHNAVTVYADGRPVIRTGSMEWWSNSIVVDPVTNELDTPGTVYVLTRDVLTTLRILADRVSVVSAPAPGAGVRSVTEGPLLFAIGVSFLWVEVEVMGRGVAQWTAVRRSVLRYSSAAATHFAALFFDNVAILVRHFTGRDIGEFGCFDCQDCTLEEIDLTTVGWRGFSLSGARTTVAGVRIDGGGIGSGFELSGDGHAVRDLVIRNTDSHGLTVRGTNHRIENVLVEASGFYGVFVRGYGHELDSITAVGNRAEGLYMGFEGSVRRVVTTANGSDGLVVFGAGSLGEVVTSNNAGMGIVQGFGWNVSGVLATNNGIGVWAWGSKAPMQNVTVVNNKGMGVWLDGEPMWLSSVVSTNNDTGLFISRSAAIADLAVTDNERDGLFIFNADGVFSGTLVVGGNGRDCTLGIGGRGLIDGTCANDGLSDAVLVRGVSLANSFVGKVFTDDAVNSSDINGASVQQDVTDPVGFEHSLRMWGSDGAAFPGKDNRGACLTEGQVCRIWDWRLQASDTSLRDVVPPPTGDDAFEVSGRWVLRGAVELDDGIGNDDLLCESGEACVYSPNIGAYQGHGALVPHSFIGAGGNIENVTLYAYERNGE